MTTPPPVRDEELMDLVRSADPLDGDADSAGGAGPLLRATLAAPRPARRRRSRRRTAAVRLAVVGAAAAVAVGAAIALPGGDRGAVAPASAAVVRHALAALAHPAGTILHVDMRGTQTNPDGSAIAWRDESWQQNGPPYDRRQVETGPDGTTVESANADGREQIYDPTTDTIYTSPPPARTHRRYWLSPGPSPGTYLLRVPVYRATSHGFDVVPGGPHESIVVTARQARAIRAGTEAVEWRRRSRGVHRRPRFRLAVVPAGADKAAPESPDPDSAGFRDRILDLLRSGRAHVVGRATVDGRDTLRIRSADGHTTYDVDPATYAPVELDTTGTGGGTRLRFITYELLSGDRADEALLSLHAQHPSAAVDRDPAHYMAAEKRLFPHG